MTARKEPVEFVETTNTGFCPHCPCSNHIMSKDKSGILFTKKSVSRSLPYGKSRPTKEERQTMMKQIIHFVMNHPGMSATVGRINTELKFNVSSDIMHWMISDLKKQSLLIEAKGRFWRTSDLPKKMEVYL